MAEENGQVKTYSEEEYRKQLAANSALIARQAIGYALGFQFGGERDLYAALGYKVEPTFDDYLAMYRRGDIAKRIVNFPANSTWRKSPVIGDGKSDTSQEQPESAFIVALKGLIETRRLWHYLSRVDRLSGIGRYGVLVLGVRDGQEASEEVVKGAAKGIEGLLYLASYSEGSAMVTDSDLVRDATDSRYGLPQKYQVKRVDGIQQVIHWRRTIHVAENLTEDDVYGEPRLEAVLNRLFDKEKLIGGGAEANWKNMDKGIQADIREGFTGEGQTLTDLEGEIDEYMHGLRRFIRTIGVDLKQLGAEVVDPSGMFNVIMETIAGTTGIPKRILLGAEMGELASSQDQENWAGVIGARQVDFAEPTILRPTLDRLIYFGVLPEPEGGKYMVQWQPLFQMSPEQEAKIADSYAAAIQKYAPPGATDMVVPVAEFREKYLKLPQVPVVDDAVAILDEEDAMAMGDEGVGVKQPADDAPENIESTAGLNGAQITAVLEVLTRLRAGELTAVVAIELLVSVGMQRERAEIVVGEIGKLPKTLPETAATGTK